MLTLASVLEGGEDTETALKPHQVVKIKEHIMLLHASYCIFLREKDSKGISWINGACQQAVDALSLFGISYSARQISRLNVEYRSNKGSFNNPNISNGLHHVRIFSHFPESKAMLEDWMNTNIETLTIDSARKYFVGSVVPTCLDIANRSCLNADEEPLLTEESLCEPWA
jgi:hypothetical protein